MKLRSEPKRVERMQICLVTEIFSQSNPFFGEEPHLVHSEEKPWHNIEKMTKMIN